MKVYLGPPQAFRSPFAKMLARAWNDKKLSDEMYETLDMFDTIFETTINKILSPITATYVKVDNYDVWGADTTLAHIIHPTLVKLKEKKQGSPQVDNDDVPEELKATEEELRLYREAAETDDKYHDRFDYVISEMIFAFDYVKNEKQLDFEEYTEETHARAQNGLRLFGKYYFSLWD